MNIPLPDPCLLVLLGVSGSGKSTFARAHFAPTEIVSSDHCRALVCDDENNQAVNPAAFAILHLIVASRLAHRRLTVIDATNVQAEARQPLLRFAQQRRVPAVALVFNFDLEICLHRNAERLSRVVPREVVEQQQHDLQQSLATLSEEGFHAIHFLTSPDDAANVTMQRKKSRRRQSDSA
jgi:protein phosphatase